MSAPAHVNIRRSVLARLATNVRAAPPLLRAPVVLGPAAALRTMRLVLRPLEAPDREAYTALLRRSRDHLAQHFPLHRSGESDEEVFARHLAYSRAAVATGLAWRRIVCRHDGAVIGAVNINDISPGPDRAGELNFWIAPDHVGMGLGRDAVHAAVHHALSRTPRGLGLARVFAYAAPDNLASRRLLEGVGVAQSPSSLPVQLNIGGRWVTHRVHERRAPAPVVALQRLLAAPVGLAAL